MGKEIRVRFPRFRKGDRVALTNEAIRRNIRGYGSRYGTVAFNPRRRMSVTVRPDGRVTASTYWAGFWRYLTPQERSND